MPPIVSRTSHVISIISYEHTQKQTWESNPLLGCSWWWNLGQVVKQDELSNKKVVEKLGEKRHRGTLTKRKGIWKSHISWNKRKIILRSHAILNRSPNARFVILPYKLFIMEVPKISQIIQAFVIPLFCPLLSFFILDYKSLLLRIPHTLYV